MVSIAWRNLSRDKVRFLISASGVAFSVFLILVLLGLFHGWKLKVTSYITNTNADLWVLQEGGDDLFDSISILPATFGSQLKEIKNVKHVSSLIGRQISFKIGGETVNTFLVGYDTKTGVGGPLRVVKGESIPKKDEILIDKVFAKNKDLDLGDTIVIVRDKELKIVGIAEGGDLAISQFSFISFDEAQDLLEMSNLVNYYLVALDNLSLQDQTKKDIKDTLGSTVNVVAKDEFINNNQRWINEIFIPILTVLIIIGFLVGLAVAGLMAYTTTVEKSREYGILKALGGSNLYLYRIVLQQSLINGIAGFVIGGVFTVITMNFLDDFVPQFVVTLYLKDIILTLALILNMIILAAFIPIYRIGRIEPAIVFK